VSCVGRFAGSATSSPRELQVIQQRFLASKTPCFLFSAWKEFCCLTDRAYAAGDSPAGARPWDEVRAPPGAQHSGSFRTISARQLQALVRQQPGTFHCLRSASHTITSASGGPNSSAPIRRRLTSDENVRIVPPVA